MRHNKAKKILGRTHNQRKALIRSLLNSLIKHGSIVTTKAKSKVIKSNFDKLAARLTRDNSLHRLRLTISSLAHPANALRLKEAILPLLKDKKSGFLKSSNLGVRRGDAAELVRLSLPVDLPAVKKQNHSSDGDRSKAKGSSEVGSSDKQKNKNQKVKK